MKSFYKLTGFILLLFIIVNAIFCNEAMTQDEIKDTNNVKVGVIKNSNLVKVEVDGKAEVINLKELYALLGINKLNRSYRTIASIEDVKIKQGPKVLEGKAVVVVISGAEGILVIFVDANNLKNYLYTGMKQKIIRKGEKENLYHSQEEGIQRPDIVAILNEGIAWVSQGEYDNYTLNYIPFIYPKLVNTSFEGSDNTTKFGIVYSEGNLTIVDGDKVLVSANIFDNYGETADTLSSLVKYSGDPRTGDNLNFNIIEDSRNMAGRDVVIEFSSDLLAGTFNLPATKSGWESTEIVKLLNSILRAGKSYLPYAVITREGIGIVEVPTEDGAIRVYKMGGKPFNVLEKDGTGSFRPLYATDASDIIFGYLETSTTENDKQFLGLYSPEYRIGIKVELKKSAKKDYAVHSKNERIVLNEGNNNVVLSISVEKIIFLLSIF